MVVKKSKRRVVSVDRGTLTDVQEAAAEKTKEQDAEKWDHQRKTLLKIIREERDKVARNQTALVMEQNAHDQTKLNLEKSLKTLLGSIELLHELSIE